MKIGFAYALTLSSLLWSSTGICDSYWPELIDAENHRQHALVVLDSNNQCIRDKKVKAYKSRRERCQDEESAEKIWRCADAVLNDIEKENQAGIFEAKCTQ